MFPSNTHRTNNLQEKINKVNTNIMMLQWKEAKGSRTFNANTPLILIQDDPNAANKCQLRNVL